MGPGQGLSHRPTPRRSSGVPCVERAVEPSGRVRPGELPATAVARTVYHGGYEGLAGDTLASALLANGVHLVGRSFKYHRPRGIVTAGAGEPNALVTVRRDAARETPNLRATQVELYEGLEAHSQNRWPSLSFDLGRANDLLSPVFPAGFYYKTFKWPRAAWASLYEPLIRRAAGLGRAPSQPDPDRYTQRFAHCERGAALRRSRGRASERWSNQSVCSRLGRQDAKRQSRSPLSS